MTNRYFLKVNGELHCPNGICRPSSASEWEGGQLLLPVDNPVLARSGTRQSAPQIQRGDELWIWTHEDEGFGRGWGLTAKASVGQISFTDHQPLILLENVERLERPFGYRDLLPADSNAKTGSRLLDHANTHRTADAYLIEDEDYADFIKIVKEQASALPDDVRFHNETEWAREIREHKDEILRDLADRRRNWQKARPAQSRFRAGLMDLYEGRCALTGISVPEALEAAHVLPHNRNPVRDRPENGILLRRDLHTMFDAMLWSIDPDTNRVRLSKRVRDFSYSSLADKEITHHIANEPLRVHFIQFLKADKNA